MSNYTIKIHDLLEVGFDFGLKDYPIWKEEHRKELNNKILEHYRFREIGFETPGLFKLYLNRTMNEIMPKYNQLYETTQYEYNPIHNADYKETYTIERNSENKGIGKTTSTSSGKGTGETSGESNSTGEINNNSTTNTERTNNAKNLKSDTPAALLEVQTIDQATYASEVGFNKDNATEKGTATEKQTNTNTSKDKQSSTSTSESNEEINSESSSNGKEIEQYSKHLLGNYGVKSTQAMIQEERENILNIDMLIIDELSNLFMQIY